MADNSKAFSSQNFFRSGKATLCDVYWKQGVIAEGAANQPCLANAVTSPFDNHVTPDSKNGNTIVMFEIFLQELIFVVTGIGSAPKFPPFELSVVVGYKW